MFLCFRLPTRFWNWWFGLQVERLNTRAVLAAQRPAHLSPSFQDLNILWMLIVHKSIDKRLYRKECRVDETASAFVDCCIVLSSGDECHMCLKTEHSMLCIVYTMICCFLSRWSISYLLGRGLFTSTSVEIWQVHTIYWYLIYLIQDILDPLNMRNNVMITSFYILLAWNLYQPE
jgi:hypothetical protein